jgi:hypothetical protein
MISCWQEILVGIISWELVRRVVVKVYNESKHRE